VQIPSGTVTLLFTDIEGSTRLWEAEPGPMAAALRRHDHIMRSAIETAGGYVFKTVGDSFCAAFRTAPAAIDAALSAQRAIGSHAWPTGRPIRVRMGVHSGVCEERDGDYFGPVVTARPGSRPRRMAVRCWCLAWQLSWRPLRGTSSCAISACTG
jgi:class 3 adenylate cyclase